MEPIPQAQQVMAPIVKFFHIDPGQPNACFKIFIEHPHPQNRITAAANTEKTGTSHKILAFLFRL